MSNVSFDAKITLGNVITIIMMAVAGVLSFARIETKNAVQDEQLSAARLILERMIAAETSQRREALQEMRAQFDKLNSKIDKLIEGRQ